eukprot:797439-Pelagomonas_calceolata.AAC.1
MGFRNKEGLPPLLSLRLGLKPTIWILQKDETHKLCLPAACHPVSTHNSCRKEAPTSYPTHQNKEHPDPQLHDSNTIGYRLQGERRHPVKTTDC